MDDIKKGVLVLNRRIGEAIFIGKEITVVVNKIPTKHQVSLTVMAPRSIRVSRSEGKLTDDKKKF